MKKLKLSLQNIEGVEVLTRAQLKMVMGGSGDGGSGKECTTDSDCGKKTITSPPCASVEYPIEVDGHCVQTNNQNYHKCFWTVVC